MICNTKNVRRKFPSVYSWMWNIWSAAHGTQPTPFNELRTFTSTQEAMLGNKSKHRLENTPTASEKHTLRLWFESISCTPSMFIAERKKNCWRYTNQNQTTALKLKLNNTEETIRLFQFVSMQSMRCFAKFIFSCGDPDNSEHAKKCFYKNLTTT